MKYLQMNDTVNDGQPPPSTTPIQIVCMKEGYDFNSVFEVQEVIQFSREPPMIVICSPSEIALPDSQPINNNISPHQNNKSHKTSRQHSPEKLSVNQPQNQNPIEIPEEEDPPQNTVINNTNQQKEEMTHFSSYKSGNKKNFVYEIDDDVLILDEGVHNAQIKESKHHKEKKRSRATIQNERNRDKKAQSKNKNNYIELDEESSRGQPEMENNKRIDLNEQPSKGQQEVEKSKKIISNGQQSSGWAEIQKRSQQQVDQAQYLDIGQIRSQLLKSLPKKLHSVIMTLNDQQLKQMYKDIKAESHKKMTLQSKTNNQPSEPINTNSQQIQVQYGPPMQKRNLTNNGNVRKQSDQKSIRKEAQRVLVGIFEMMKSMEEIIYADD